MLLLLLLLLCFSRALLLQRILHQHWLRMVSIGHLMSIVLSSLLEARFSSGNGERAGRREILLLRLLRWLLCR
jgi:hypothetical protein